MSEIPPDLSAMRELIEASQEALRREFGEQLVAIREAAWNGLEELNSEMQVTMQRNQEKLESAASTRHACIEMLMAALNPAAETPSATCTSSSAIQKQLVQQRRPQPDPSRYR
jgi:hypothetical protein